MKKDIDLNFTNQNKNILNQGKMKIKKMKFFKQGRYCKLYDSGRMMFLSEDKKKIKNDFFINK